MKRSIITIDELKRLPCAHRNKHLFAPHSKKLPKIVKRSKEKEWILSTLQNFCNQNELVLELELRFNEFRKFRFDYAIKSLKLAIEFEGIMSDKSRHTTVKGYSIDADKYNLAQKDGWTVLRYTVLNYKNLLTDLKQCEKWEEKEINH